MNLRVGLIVPSSNVTMETEIPLYLKSHFSSKASSITFHSSRTRMKKVTPEELQEMATDSERCALEIADARVDVVAHACLVATMFMGWGAHRRLEEKLNRLIMEESVSVPVPAVTSAGLGSSDTAHLKRQFPNSPIGKGIMVDDGSATAVSRSTQYLLIILTMLTYRHG